MGNYVYKSQWKACTADGRCDRDPDDADWGRGNRPVINVSWEDARTYVRWLSWKTGERYHLPSESEWEYAARAGSQTRYAWGDEIGHNRANCLECGDSWEKTAPVGSFSPNAFGLHDMHGNVWEWVEDCFFDTYAGAPADGTARWQDYCADRAVRGGAANGSQADVRSAVRFFGADREQADLLGFRVAKKLAP
ncbi:MAG: SUMF1/EgtB/PvdO family nonheme iron enzyme [Rhodospirillales bacterium]|nr:SUMF1/EgtB/PvdO family nonheme iron enzyme [Rhodospirillales bacterium]